jgi:hypothetical protein
MYAGLPYVLAPVIGNPIALAGRYVSQDIGGPQQVAALVQTLQRLLPMLGRLAEVLPQETLLWKLQLLEDGCQFLDTRYDQVCCSYCYTYHAINAT